MFIVVDFEGKKEQIGGNLIVLKLIIKSSYLIILIKLVNHY